MDKKSFPEDKLDMSFTELLLNNVHDGIYFVDQDCKIFFWNKGAEQITGFDQSTVSGKKCSENILNPVDDAGKNLCEEDCPVKQALTDGKTIA